MEGFVREGFVRRGFCPEGVLSRVLPAHNMWNVSIFYKLLLLHIYHVLHLSLNKRHNFKQIIINSFSEICL